VINAQPALHIQGLLYVVVEAKLSEYVLGHRS